MDIDGHPRAWAWEAIVDRPVDEPLRASVERIRPALHAEALRLFPEVGMATIEGGDSVVLPWVGGPTTDEVVDALGLGFDYESRGAVVASIESWDTEGWPEDLELLSIVLKRIDPETGRLPQGTVRPPALESSIIAWVRDGARQLP